MSKPANPQDTTVSLRLNEKLLERLEERADEVRRQRPYDSVSLSDVVRSTLVRGLDCRDDD